MDQKRRDTGFEDIVGFDACANTCVGPQAVIKYKPAGDNGSEDSSLGAFILATVKIMVDTDLEGGDDVDDSIG